MGKSGLENSGKEKLERFAGHASGGTDLAPLFPNSAIMVLHKILEIRITAVSETENGATFSVPRAM